MRKYLLLGLDFFVFKMVLCEGGFDGCVMMVVILVVHMICHW